MGQTSSVLNGCGEKVTDDQCFIDFGTGNVSRFGEVGPNELNGDADIAGKGVTIAFLGTTIFALVCIVLRGGMRTVYCFRHGTPSDAEVAAWLERLEKDPPLSVQITKKLEELILSAGDAQLFLIFAFGIAFQNQSQCGISLYHYLLATHMVLAALATVILSMINVQDYHKPFLSSLFRIILVLICSIAVIQARDPSSTPGNDIFFGRLPAENQTDSAIVLPAACVLERRLNQTMSPSQQELIIHHGPELHVDKNKELLLTAMFVTVFVRLTWMGAMWFTPGPRIGSPTHVGLAVARAFLQLVGFGYCLYVIIENWTAIIMLRAWVNRSPWLNREEGKNPEELVEGIGQLAPLIALLVILVAVADVVSLMVGKKFIPWYEGDKRDYRESE